MHMQVVQTVRGRERAVFIRCFQALALIPLFCAFSVSVPAQQSKRSTDFSSARTSFDSGNWLAASSEFHAIVGNQAAVRRPADELAEAAVFSLRCRVNLQDVAGFESVRESCLAAARGSAFEGQALLEVGKHLAKNTKDTTAAIDQFNAVVAAFPGDVFAASGALYERGLLECDSLRMPHAAKESLDAVTKRYPSSPFCDDALVVLARVERVLGNVAGIDEAARRLKEMGAAPALRQKVQFEKAEYHNKIRQNRHDAVCEYQAVIDSFPTEAKSQAAAQARVRMADLVPGGNFHASMELYRQVRDEKAAPAATRAWSALNLAYMQFQVRDEEGAARTLEALVADKSYPAAYKAKASEALKALRDPDSVENAQLRYDRAARCRQVNHSFDVAFFDYRSVVRKFDGRDGAPAAAAARVKELPREDQAQWHYKVAFAQFMTGHGQQALDLCERILKEMNPSGVTKWQCLYMIAYLKGRGGDDAESARGMRQIADTCPVDEVTMHAYMELVRLLDLMGDEAAVVLTLEEFRVRYPRHHWSEQADAFQKHFFSVDTSLIQHVEESRPALVAKWGGRLPGGGLPDADHPSHVIASDAITIPTGGAQ